MHLQIVSDITICCSYHLGRVRKADGQPSVARIVHFSRQHKVNEVWVFGVRFELVNKQAAGRVLLVCAVFGPRKAPILGAAALQSLWSKQTS